MSWIANIKGTEHPEGFANAEAALDFVAEVYKSDISRDTDLIRSAYRQVEEIEVDGYFAGATWHICRPLIREYVSTDQVNPLVGLIKSPEEILRDQKNRLLENILISINSQLEEGLLSSYATTKICLSISGQDYGRIEKELKQILRLKKWEIINKENMNIYLKQISP